MELEVTWHRVIRVWWAHIWRSLIAMLVSMIVGGVLGGILGLVMGAAGASLDAVRIAALPVGIIVGLGLSLVPMKLILGKDFGEFRLVLVRKLAKEPGAPGV